MLEKQLHWKAAVEPLLKWYDQNKRRLPWRENPTPYRVWVSEIMLQQTRVEAVKPYYARFMKVFPTLPDLAAASTDQLMKLWEGLGYYSRARHLQKAALQCVAQYGGELPSDYQALLELPGIGEYTAGAVASIAFGIPVPAVDGNVLRVAARLLADDADIALPQTKKALHNDLSAVMPQDRSGDLNQALMELGATVCLPNGTPRCGSCPLTDLCMAHALGRQEQLPVKRKKKPRVSEVHTVMLIVCGGRVALRRRPDTGLLAGLWEFPYVLDGLSADEARTWAIQQGMDTVNVTRLGDYTHIFTHREWHMQGFLLEVTASRGEYWWVDRKTLETQSVIPSAYRPYADELRLFGGLF